NARNDSRRHRTRTTTGHRLQAGRDGWRHPRRRTDRGTAVAMPSDTNAFRFEASRRRGPKPRTTKTNPHTQLDQNAPAALQEAVFAHVSSLPGVRVGDSFVSVPGARAFHLDRVKNSGADGFMVEHEFAHLHPP